MKHIEEKPDCGCQFSVGDDPRKGVLGGENYPPLCNPGPNLIIHEGVPEFVLNASASSDFDGPGRLGALWKVLQTPYFPNNPPFKITNPDCACQKIDSKNLIPGNYEFVLYVSDDEYLVPCLWKVTILPTFSDVLDIARYLKMK